MLRRVVAAVVIGTATILVTKPERDRHWSIPPTAVVETVAHVTPGPGDPPRLPG